MNRREQLTRSYFDALWLVSERRRRRVQRSLDIIQNYYSLRF
jgi:hypothetical protein